MTPDPTLEYDTVIRPLVNQALSAVETGQLATLDRRDGRVYEIDTELQFAAELALVTGRPLLLRGDPGTGKSSLAAFLARNLGYRYYESVITSQTSAQDLLWTFDLVRRLADAQASPARAKPGEPPPPLSDYAYIEPGVLWWAMDRESAGRRGWSPASALPEPGQALEPFAEINQERDPTAAVVLLDEIDKADPDLPNALLVPLGSSQFGVADIKDRPIRVSPAVAAPKHLVDGKAVSRLLIVITTNEERELPQAFLRRCIVHWLEHPKADRLVKIARCHFDLTDAQQTIAGTIAKRLETLRAERVKTRRRLPGTAEYLDAVRASIALNVKPDSTAWSAIERITLLKDENPAR